MLVLSTTLQEAATSGSGVVVDTEARAREMTFYVLGSTGVSAGEVTLEEAHDPAYAGTWQAIGAPMVVTGNAVAVRRLRGACRAVRARITTAIVGGTVTVLLMGSAEGGIAPGASAMITLGIGTPSSINQFLLVGLGGDGAPEDEPAVEVDPAVFPDDVLIEIGVGGIFRHRVIDQSFACAAWSGAEFESGAERDITGRRHSATWNTTVGLTRGVSVDIPEGGLAVTSTGTQYAEAADDSTDDPGFRMSLDAGSMDVYYGPFWTTTNDATLRCLVQKQVTNSAGNGWHLAMQNGAARGFLRVGGVTIFDISGGAIADGVPHRLHLCYEPEESRVRLFLDNAIVASATGVTTEPANEACNLRIGAFNNHSGSVGFIGTRSYVMIGREGNPDLSGELEPTMDWTDITDDVVVSQMPISWKIGNNGTGVQDNVAGPGTMTLALDNGITNTAGLQGYYTVGHANCRAGFKKWIPIRLTILYDGDPHVKFRGFIKSADPTPGEHGEQYVALTCVDWMYVSMRAYTSALPIQIDETAETLFGIVVDAAERPPVAVEVHAGSEQFPFSFDNSHGEDDSPMSEFVRIATSERGFIYVRGDGTLVHEGRDLRQLTTDLAATFSFQHGLEPTYDVDRIINVVRATFYPRRSDALPTTVLASLPTQHSEHFLAPGAVIELEGQYRDPAQKIARVGGTDMQDPTPSTDYTMHTDPEGTGTDLTSDLLVTAVYGANLVKWRLENRSSTAAGYITKLQARGIGLYHDEAPPVVARDEASIREHGERPLSIDLPYVSSMSSALAIANMILGQFSQQERVIPTAITMLANYSDAVMRDTLARDLGHRIGIEEPMTAIDTDGGALGYYIQSEEGTIEEGPLVTVKLGLSLPLPTGVAVTDDPVLALVDSAIVGL